MHHFRVSFRTSLCAKSKQIRRKCVPLQAHFLANHTHFYTKGLARRLILKQRHKVNFIMNHHTLHDLVLLNFIHH